MVIALMGRSFSAAAFSTSRYVFFLIVAAALPVSTHAKSHKLFNIALKNNLA